jgi:hypothetical protein
MNSDIIFTVTNDDLDRLDERTAVDFFQRMLWAEARRIGIEISKINVSSRIHVPDGGVDAAVDEVQIATGSGLIQPGRTSYQIKAGQSFRPWRESEIRKELFDTKTPKRQHLGESIHACLDAGGTYILVCTGIDLVETQHRNALNHIKNYLEQCGYLNPKVDVWSQNKLIGFLKFFPSLALWVTGRDNAQFQTHSSWSQDANMQVPFFPGQSQNELIANIQNELRRNDDTVHVRVWGEPGIGKTKLVLEATRTEDVSPLVIYCSASQFRDSDLMIPLLQDDNHFSAVVVIDECDPGSRFYIWDKLRYRGPRIKLITIYNDYEERAGGITYYDTPPLEDEQIRNIITEEYRIPADQANRWAELCDGSPRVAHVIGWNLVNYPEDLLKPPSTVDVWERYIAAGDAPNSDRTEQRRLVLQHLALFKRFGYERSVAREAQAIAKKIEEANPQITLDKFEDIIHQLRERRILQGEFTLYITPKALHIKLWTQWWERHHRLFKLEVFTQDLPEELVEYFYEMFQYAAESEAASRIVEDLLGPNGPFQNDENLKTRLGSRFFLALTEADPKSALKCLMRTIGTWDRETLLHFTEGRREVVWALEKIAMWENLFADAARLLLALGEAENESWSNNASGVFIGLFSPAIGKVAPTEASPAKRFPVLKGAFESGSKRRRDLALHACSAALESGSFSRIGNAEYQGLRPEPNLWMPETYGEIYEAYRRVWLLLVSQLERLPEDERKEGIEILLGHVRGLARIPDLAEMVVDTVSMIIKKMYVSEKQIIATITQLLNYEGKELPKGTRKRWEQLRNELVKPEFHSMMQRYVGMDLLEDKFDENRNQVDQVQLQIEKLAQQVIETPSLLQPELYWLVTTEAKKGYQFGHELGKRDDGFTLLPTLLDSQRNAGENASVYFLGGYFRAIFDSNVAEWEKQLDALVADTTLNITIPELTNCSSVTDRAGWRILNLATSGIINVNHFGIFHYGKVTESLTDEVFTAWIEFLLNAAEKSAVSIALHLYHDYYIFPKPKPTLPRDLTFRILSHPSLFEESDGFGFGTMTDHYWTEIGKVFVDLHSEKSLELVEPILSNFGQDGTIIDIYSQTCSVLDQITRRHRGEVWEQVSKLLEDQTNFSRTASLERWLREGNSLGQEESAGTLAHIPRKKIWDWVNKDVENRAWRLAYRLVPKTLSVARWRNSLVREVLMRYGEREEVRSGLRSNYLTEGWSGPGSLHYKEKQQKLLRLKEGEDNENVKRWIDEFVDALEDSIEYEKIDEERRF